MYKTKTMHPSLSHYSSTKWGEGRGGDGYFKFRPIGGALIRMGPKRGRGALIRRFTVFASSSENLLIIYKENALWRTLNHN